MNKLIPLVAFSLHLLLGFTTAGYGRINWLQTYYFTTDDELTAWGSIEMEDMVVLAYNDSQQFIPKQSWAKANMTNTIWKNFNYFLKHYLSYVHQHILQIRRYFAERDPYTIQCWTRCTSSMDDIDGIVYRVALKGDDLLYLNISEIEWIAGSSNYSEDVLPFMQKDAATNEGLVEMLRTICKNLATSLFNAGKDALARRIQPQVHITSRPALSETEILCVVTGFYPKPINVSLWQEDKMEDMTSTETLPNGDGTYQIIVNAIVSLREEQDVFCRVEHSSLKEPLMVQLERKHHIWYGLAVGAIITVIVCVVGLVGFVKQYKRCR
ncbi:zinc finger and BTB domain-containing protein 12 isoform X3 [Hyperolius riggenbachi]